MTRLYVVMGVAGCGKSLIGSMVAQSIGGTYIDADDLHPQANIEKMSSGEPLTDADRWPWLVAVATKLKSVEGVGLIGCSALKKSYRDIIRDNTGEAVTFIFLSGSKELIAARMAARTDHFMPTTLLDSQFATLEIPGEKEGVIKADIDTTPEAIVQFVRGKIYQS